ncbi:hypothetical protein OsJ_17138 [Oryza sativa Japonica Group]|uniref:Uncharacterized protein n=1 Tax=Oryza sativa subsp. japonica TaxID=39947 RepID=B9FMH2_ORYSJ|nr:hypothetical protein OsJ_17138 [Oryza sativa Japonica Group]
MDFGVEAQHLSAIFHGVNVNGLDIDMVGRSAKAYGAELREYGDNGTCHELKLRLLEKGGRSMSSYGGDIGGFEVSQRLPSTGNPFATL